MAALTRNAGFTLLEMLLVVALLAVLAGMAGLSVSGDVGRHVQAEADRLKQALQMAADEAVFQGVEMGVAIAPDRYYFLKYDNATQRWNVLEDKGLRLHRVAEDVRLGLTLLDTKVALDKKLGEHPAIVFLSSGEVTAFSLSVASSNRKRLVVLGTDGINPIGEQVR